MKYLIICLWIFSSCQAQTVKSEDTVYIYKQFIHKCNIKYCEQKNRFIMISIEDIDSDEYWLEEIHFYHPELTEKERKKELRKQQLFAKI